MKKLALSIIAVSSIFFSSCEEDKKVEHPHVSIEVEHKVDSLDLAFDTLLYVNTAGHKYEVQTLKYFISNIQLHKSGGTKTTIKGPFYIDAEDQTTLSLDGHTDLSSGEYEKISLTFGLDTTLNISNSLTSAEEVAMNWPSQMGGGYHYMKLEGTYDSLQLGTIKNFAVHTGASMGDPYHIDIDIPNSNFTVGSDDISINISMDVNEWFQDPNVYNFADYSAMIMMNMQAQMALKANGKSVFTVSIK